MKILTSITVLLLLCTPAVGAAGQQDVVGQEVTLTLTNGSKVSGTVTKREDGKVSLKADLIGEIVIEEKDVAGFGPGPTAAPTQTAPAQAVSPTVKWTRTGTVGYTFVSGAAIGIGNTNGANLAASVERAAPTQTVGVTALYTYQRTLPNVAAANSGLVTLSYNRPFTKSLTFVSQSIYATDKVQRVNYRFTTLNGVGFVPLKTKKVSLTLVPGIGVMATDYDVTGVVALLLANLEKNAVGYGAYDHLAISLMPTLTFDQTFLHFHSFSNSSVHLSQAAFSLIGLVSPKIGISISLLSNYDSQLPEPYINRRNTTVTTGLQFKF
jgi:hypothetical protein